MPHWKLTLSYNGTQFHGWQVQPGLDTVQGRLADAITRITGETVLPQGSGRTDAGVHALAQVASFELRTSIPPPNLQRALNRTLPPGIRIDRAQLVDSSFHARHSARRKLYEYRLFERRIPDTETAADRICSPFLAPFVWDCRWALCLERLQAAAALLLGTHDFSAMAAKGREARTLLKTEPACEAATLLTMEQARRGSCPNAVKTIFHSAWSRADGILIYRVCGSGFLHHMVRNLVGTMVDIGRGSLKLEELPKILSSHDRALAGPTAPASGLYLVEVEYDNKPLGVYQEQLSQEQSSQEQISPEEPS